MKNTPDSEPMKKISPELQIILAEKGYPGRAARSSADAASESASAEDITFFLQYKDSLEPLKALGFQVLSQSGNVVVGKIALDKLEVLAEHPNVILIEKPLPPSVGLDHSIPDIKANQVWSRSGDNFSGNTGKDVIIGVIDTGIDFTHKTFRKADNSTRIQHIWDQTLTKQGSETVPGPINHATLGNVALGYGVQFNNFEITAALGNSNPFSVVRHRDSDGHGTHVAGIAAGDGSQSDACCGAYTYVGVAPEAELIIVRMRGLTTGDPTPTGTEMVDAIRFIIDRAGGKPVAINLSIYTNTGRRDIIGSEATSIDNILNTFSQGVAVVFIAGNEGDKNRHATGTIPSATGINVKCRMSPGLKQDIWIGIHCASSNVRMALKHENDAALTSFVNNGNTQTFNTNNINNGGSVTVSNSTGDIWIKFTPPQNGSNQSGIWDLRLESTGGADIPFDAWSQMKKGPAFIVSAGVTVPASSSVSPYANGDNVIVVGAHATEGSNSGSLAAFSSRGPLLRFPDGNPLNIRPHITAPGVSITSALTGAEGGCCCDCCYDFYKSLDGTSMAAPHVTGAVALMLQKNKTRSFSQIRDDLKNSARPVGGQVLPNNDWGWGKLDVKAAVDAVPVPPAPLRTPSPPPAEPVTVPFSPATPPDLAALRDEFFSIPKAKFYQKLVVRHFQEVRSLINTNKRVATVWHRNGGPALIRLGMQTAFQPERPLPVEIEGVSLVDRVTRIAEIVKKYGSEMLNHDIETHLKDWLWVLAEGFSVRQLLDVLKEQEIEVIISN